MSDPQFPTELTDELVALAHDLANVAGRETLRYFRQSALAVDNKLATGFDPVTQADRAAEQAMRDLLAKRRPQDGILGEEQGDHPSQSGLVWVLDPIDGTRGFLTGTPTWGILVALCHGTRPLFGLIDQPYIGERFEGGFGRAQMRGPQGAARLATRPTAKLSQARLFSTFPEIGSEAERARFDRVKAAVQLTRYGTDCYGYALLAAGHVDLVIEAGLQPYDVAAPIAVIEAAGGIVTDWQGGSADQGGQVLAAANPDIHRAALALLAG